MSCFLGWAWLVLGTPVVGGECPYFVGERLSGPSFSPARLIMIFVKVSLPWTRRESALLTNVIPEP